MSKVAIVGDPSGTGTFTISAPNGNTDRTLVLPDEAGTVLTSASGLTAGNLTGSVPASAMPAGSVIQHKYAILYPSGDISGSSSTYTEVSSDLRVSFQMLDTSNYVVLKFSTTSSGYIASGSTYLHLDVQDINSGSFTADTMAFIGPGGSLGIPASGTRIITGAVWGGSSRTVSLYFRASASGNTVYPNWAGNMAMLFVEVMEIAA